MTLNDLMVGVGGDEASRDMFIVERGNELLRRVFGVDAWRYAFSKANGTWQLIRRDK